MTRLERTRVVDTDETTVTHTRTILAAHVARRDERVARTIRVATPVTFAGVGHTQPGVNRLSGVSSCPVQKGRLMVERQCGSLARISTLRDRSVARRIHVRRGSRNRTRDEERKEEEEGARYENLTSLFEQR